MSLGFGAAAPIGGKRRFEGWEDFAARNPDHLQKELLAKLYPPEVLASALARTSGERAPTQGF